MVYHIPRRLFRVGFLGVPMQCFTLRVESTRTRREFFEEKIRHVFHFRPCFRHFVAMGLNRPEISI